MADTSVKLSGTYDSIEAYNIMVEMQNMSADYEEIRTEAAAAASAATAASTAATNAVNTANTVVANAQTYAGNANTSAGEAAGYASDASTAANNAASSETNAYNSEVAAAASASSAAASEAVVAGALPLSGGTLTGVVNGVTPPVGDNTTKLATTEYVRNEISPIGMTYFGEWIANSSSTTNVELTQKIENVPIGKYLVLVKMPVINIATCLVNVAIAGVNVIGGSSMPILNMAGQTAGSFAIEVTNSTNAIVVISGSSTSVTFSNFARGGLTLVRISG